MNGKDQEHRLEQPGEAQTQDTRHVQDTRRVQDTRARKQRSIRTRLLTLAWGMTIVTIVLITAVAIDSANNVGRRAQQISSTSLRAQAEAHLAQINAGIAEQNNLILDRAARDVQTVAAAAVAIFSGETPSEYWHAQEHIFPGSEGQYMNDLEDTSSVFVPVTEVTDQNTLPDEVLQDIQTSAYLDLALEPVFQNNPNAAAIYLGTVNDVTRYYPNIGLGNLVPADFQVTQRPWYTSALAGNSGRQTPLSIWSPVYLDATGLGLVTTVAIPVYDQGSELVGVVGLDITLDEIRTNIETTQFFQNGYSFLIDQEGKAIILPTQGYQDILNHPPDPDDFSPDLTQAPEFAPVIERMVAGESGFENISVGGRELFVAYAPLESTGWSLGSVAAAEDVLQSIPVLQADLRQTTQFLVLTRVLPAVIMISMLLVALALIWTNRLVNPIQKLAEAAQKIGAGQWELDIPVRGGRQHPDEIDLLANTLSDMAAQLRQSFAELEQRVVERTRQLEHRSLQLQTAAEVARDITTAQNLEQMLHDAVNLVSERFGFYNVGIFLVDETGRYAHLRAASGDLGAKLLDQNIRLSVDQQSIIGYVIRNSEPRIAADVSADSMYLEVSLLPDTRSEVAFPLRATLGGGERVIGALDVQSTQKDAFDPDDVTILQTLADQLAIAIENTRLVAQLQATIKETRLLFQEQVREAWLAGSAQSGPMAFEYDRLEVRPAGHPTASWAYTSRAQDSQQGDPDDQEHPAGIEHRRLVVPVKLREQVIGFIGLESDDPNHEWTEDEITIVEATANQAALTVENARLLAESRRRAAREQIVGEVTSQMRASLDVDTVLQTAIREIAEKLGVAQVEVHLGAELEEDGREHRDGQDHHGGQDHREGDSNGR